jgi:DNA gyrase subunit A
MGRVAAGVKGIALREKDQVVAAVIAANGRDNLLTVSEGGYGKRTHLDQYRLQTRGGKGIINMRVTAKTGPVLGAILVGAGDEVVLLTSGNKIIRMDVSEISQTRGRATQGVRLVQMDGGHVAGFDLVLDKGIDEGE